MLHAGVHTITAKAYHADPCETPSLSSSIARTLLDKSPQHAWTDHPRLNPDHEPEHRDIYDRGSAAHALLLEGEDRMVVIEANDYRKDKAKEERDAARAAGKHPILVAEYPNIRKMRDVATVAIAQCRYMNGATLRDGTPESTFVWKEKNGVWCRVRVDWIKHDRKLILDYKSTAASANPHSWVRTMLGMGGDVQGSFYLRGNAATDGPAGAKFVFLVQEVEEPFACSFIGLPPGFIELGDAKVERAISEWHNCLSRNDWPGYPKDVCWVDPPAWAFTQWEERDLGRGIPYDPAKLYAGAFADEHAPAA